MGYKRTKNGICAAVLAFALAAGSMAPLQPVQVQAKTSTAKKTKKTTKKKTAKKSDGSKILLDRYKKEESRYLVMAYVGTKGKRVSVRSTASSKGKKLHSLQYGDAMVVNPNRIRKGKKTAWVPVYLHHKKNTGNKKYGMWKTAYIKATDIRLSVLDMTKMVNKYNKYSAKAIRYGMKYLGAYHENGGIRNGVQYGTNMRGGVACSYFVNRCYRAAGKSMPPSFMSAILAACKRVRQSEMRPGDIIFYYDGGTLGHVAIYMGNGFMISASGHYGQHYPNGGICIKRVNYGSRGLFNAKIGRVKT